MVLLFSIIIIFGNEHQKNNPPRITNFYPENNITVDEGEKINFEVLVTDNDGDALTYTWFLDDNEVLKGRDKSVWFWVPNYNFSGEHIVIVRISDGRESVEKMWVVHVRDVNRAPIIFQHEPNNFTIEIYEGENVTFRVSAFDPDNNELFFTWLVNDMNASTKSFYVFHTSYDSSGTYTIKVVVSDGNLRCNITWHVEVININTAPRILFYSPSSNITIHEGEQVNFSVEVIDDDGDKISYKWYRNGNDVSNDINYTLITNYDDEGLIEVMVIITDGYHDIPITWNVRVINVNREPVITGRNPSMDVKTYEYEKNKFSVSVYDPDNDIITVLWYVDFETISMGEGFIFNYTFGYDTVGNHTVRAEISDGYTVIKTSWNVTVDRKKFKWTFLVYMSADNDLEHYAIEDLNEMELVGSTNEVHIIVQIDRHPSFDTSNGNWIKTRRYRVVEDDDTLIINSELLQELGEKDMGSSLTLKGFLHWATIYFPAENYALVLWGHGSGWKGICHDFSSSTKLSLKDIKNSIEFFQEMTNNSLKVVECDVCYWAMTEIGYELHNVLDYIVASEALEPNSGATYNLFLQKLIEKPEMNGKELAMMIAYHFGEAYTDGKPNPMDNDTFTQSAVDLRHFSELPLLMNNLSMKLINETKSSQILQYARDLVEEYEDPDFVDLYHLLENIQYISNNSEIRKACSKIMNFINESVIEISNGPMRKNSHGISIYFPRTEYSYSQDYEKTMFANMTLWDEVLVKYYMTQNGGRRFVNNIYGSESVWCGSDAHMYCDKYLIIGKSISSIGGESYAKGDKTCRAPTWNGACKERICKDATRRRNNGCD